MSYDIANVEIYTLKATGDAPDMRRPSCAGVRDFCETEKPELTNLQGTWGQTQSSLNSYFQGGESIQSLTVGINDVYYAVRSRDTPLHVRRAEHEGVVYQIRPSPSQRHLPQNSLLTLYSPHIPTDSPTYKYQVQPLPQGSSYIAIPPYHLQSPHQPCSPM